MRKARQSRYFRPQVTQLEDRVVPHAGAPSAILYVDANIAAHSSSTIHDGSSWATAFNNLQSALQAAGSTSGPEQIWIAQGAYKPSQVYTPLNASSAPVVGGLSGLNVANLETFNLPDNVSLYGGFVYGGTSLSQRSPNAHPTILSGDLSGNDIEDPTDPSYAASKADNAWHVVTLGDDVTHTGVTATLDGLTIVDGYANGANNGGTLSPFIYGHLDGGGVYSAFGSNLTVNNCTFQHGYAGSDGGGLFSDGSNLLVTNSTFLNNSAITRAGALEGLNDFENGVSHTSTLVNDYFQDNTCTVFGGAVVGEGAYQGANSGMSITGCTFVHNQAGEGGAIVFDTLTITITGSTFLNNIATVDAGAIATTNVVGTIVAAPNDFATTITGSSFIGNVCLADPAAHVALNNFTPGVTGLNFANGGGALVCYMNGFLNVDNDLFLNNVTKNGEGGAILNGTASANTFGISAFVVHTTVSNSVFIGNQAQHGAGGAIASDTDALTPGTTSAANVLLVTNCAFGGNQASGNGGGVYFAASTVTISNNIFAFDSASQGDGVYGKTSQVNGHATSDPLALTTLKKKNTFLFDDAKLA